MTPLESFVHDHLGPVERLPTPTVVGGTRLLRVRDRAGVEWFAKQLLRPRQWSAESSAYELWGDHPQVPHLRATSSELQALLTAGLPGHQPRGQYRPALHAAGRLLAQLHAVPAPTTWDSAWRDLVVADTDRHLAYLRRRGVEVADALVRESSAELVTLVVPEVATHGDYQPHNWRWHRGHFTAFDFGAAARRPAAWDLARVRVGACWSDPPAYDALLAGYGRALAPEEELFVERMMPWRAVVALSFGIRHDRRERVEHGTSVLEALARGEVWGRRRLISRRHLTSRLPHRRSALAPGRRATVPARRT